MATLHLILTDVAETYEVHEWRNAAGVLSTAHPMEWQDVKTYFAHSSFDAARS